MEADDLQDVLSAVRTFVREDVVPLEQKIEDDDELPSSVVEGAKAMGLFGFALPEEYGGLGLDTTEQAKLVMELGYTTPALRSLIGTNNGIAGHVLVESGTDRMAEGNVSFSLKGRFDRSRTEQSVLVGVFEACDGKKGSFVLVLDEGTRKGRFVDEIADKAEFAALQAGRGEIHVLHCLECDNASTLRWNARKRAFGWK